MKFKKALAAILAAAMLVSSVGVTGITDPVIVEAAETNVYKATIKNGTADVTGGSVSVAYGDSVTLDAVVEKNSNTTATRGTTVYKWSVLNADGTEYKVNNQAVTGTNSSFTFTPSGAAGTSYKIQVTIGQNYTDANGSAVYEELLKEEQVTINTTSKTVQKTDIVEPTFNKVYLYYATDSNYKKDSNGKAYVTVGDVKDTLLNSTDNHGGAWTVVNADTTQLYEGANELELKYTIPSDSKTYVGFWSDKTEDKDTTWAKDSNGNYYFTIKKSVTVSPAADYVSSITAESVQSQLVYNPKVTTNVNSTQIKVEYDGTYDKNTSKYTSVVPTFTADDPNAVSLNYNSNTQVLTVTAIGTTTNKDNIVTITAEDPSGTGLKKEIKVPVYKGVLLEDVAFDAGFTSIKTEKTYDLTLKPKEIFDYELANKNEAEADPAQKKHITYTFNGGTNDVGQTWTFTGIYTLQPGEKYVTYTNNTYSISAGTTISTLRSVTFTPFEITEDYINSAINALKSGDTVLNGNTSIEYGTDITTFVNANAGITLPLYRINSKGDAIEVTKGSEYAIPEVGAHTTDYVVKVSAVTNTNYHIADSLCKNYPISFTVVKKNLAANVTVDGGAYKATVQESKLGTHTLTAKEDAYTGADKHYTYAYQWYKNGEKIEKAIGETYSVTAAGTYYCVVTATALPGTTGNLATTTAQTKSVEFIETDIKVVERTEDNNGNVTVGTADLATTNMDAKTGTYLSTPGKFSIQVQVPAADEATSTSYTLGNTVNVVLKKTDGTVVDTKAFTNTNSTRLAINYTASYDVAAGDYEIWVEASGTKTVGTTTTAQKYNAKIGTYTVGAYAPTITTDKDGVALDLVEKNGTTAITYGDKPSEKLSYVFKLSDTAIKAGNLTEEQATKINELVNANITFTIDGGDTILPAIDSQKLSVTAKANTNPSANINVNSISTKSFTPAAVKVNKKSLRLAVDVAEGADGVVWTLGKENVVTATYNAEDFVGEETAEKLGIKNNYSYKIYDADGNDVSKSTIGAGEYTIKVDKVDEISNYEVVPGEAKLTVVAEATEISAENVLVEVGKTANITVVSAPGNAVVAADSAKYESADTTIATVDEKGVVTGVKAGTTTITVTKDELKTELTVTVVDTNKVYTEDEMQEVKDALTTAEADKAAAEAAQKVAEAAKAAAEKAQAAAEAAQKAAEQKAATAATATTVKKGDLVVVGKHIYKVLSTSKKTVAFAGTISTAKSIKIAATVKINGVSYKVTRVAANALKNNKTVTKVTIGKNVTTIKKNAFSGCTKLKTVTVKSSSLKTVGKNAFKSIKKTATIKVPSKKVSAYKKLLNGKMPSTVKVSK